MSYLSYPRLCFAGRFQADPSTVNNDPLRFDDDRFLARYQRSGQTRDNWNPAGSGAFRLRGCVITSVWSADAQPALDALLGGSITDADDRVSAKIVDLDPEQQGVSQIWGLRIAAADASGAPVFRGSFAVTPFADLWRRSTSGAGATAMGAFYQSVLEDVVWAGELSGVARELRDHLSGDRLSIKLNLDGAVLDPQSPDFTFGRIVGVIGPYLEGEPLHFVPARVLQPAVASSNNIPCTLDAASLVLDLGNALPTTSPGGALQNLGTLNVVANPSGAPQTLLGTVDTSSESLYPVDAGIVRLSLDTEQVTAARASPIAVVAADGTTLAAERADGAYVRADDFVFRLYPDAEHETARTTLWATRFGDPAPGVDVTAAFDEAAMAGNTPSIGIPQNALTFPARVTTDVTGRAELQLTAHDPGNPRGYIDGQFYLLAYGWDGDTGAAAGNEMSVLVWDAHDVPASPTWIDDVEPILQQYSNLYPVMRDVIDLSGYHSVVAHTFAMEISLGLPPEDPNHMPVTRDLSPGKRATIVSWLADPQLLRLDNVDALRRALQFAIELEHATIPPYLYALFSIVPGRNEDVATRIRSVVMQEMLHMALAANLLNAVGGHPSIGQAGFVPSYPAHLPGGVRPDLVVTLRKCSIAQVRDVFMAIEQPDEPLNDASALRDVSSRLRDVRVGASGNIDVSRATGAMDTSGLGEALRKRFAEVDHVKYSVAWFYDAIARALIQLDAEGGVFIGDASRQLTPQVWPGAPGRLYRITDLTTALSAVEEIIHQGEGTSATDPGDAQPDEVAHYYRFEEIVRGRQLLPHVDGWRFDGPSVRFDPTAVYPAIDDPATEDTRNPQAQRVAADFDRAYTALLGALHDVFNGTQSRFNTAVGLMLSLEVLGRRLMRLPADDDPSVTAGPLFQTGTFVAPTPQRFRRILGYEKSGFVDPSDT